MYNIFFTFLKIFRFKKTDEIKPKKVRIPSARMLDFNLWAFGFPVPECPYDKVEEWNKLHGHKLRLDENDLADLILPEMYDIYLDEKENFNGRTIRHIKK